MNNATPNPVSGEWPADRVERRSISSLRPFQRNPKDHPAIQVSRIADSIKSYGWVNPIIIDETGEIIGGHGRVEAAKLLGLTEVPCVVVTGWDEPKRRAYRIADNSLAEGAPWNIEFLKFELGALQEIGFDLPSLGFDDAKLVEFMAGLPGTSGGTQEPEEAQRELTDAEKDFQRRVWRIVISECDSFIKTMVERGCLTTSITKGALAVYFFRSLTFGTDIHRNATAA